MPRRINQHAPLATIGGKSQVIESICEVIEYAIKEYDLVGVADYFMGSCRLFLHLDSPRELDFKLANDIDRGVICFYKCLQDPYQTDLLIDEIQLIAEYYKSKEQFEKAKLERIDERTSQIRAAALTYIVSKYSRASDRENFSGANTVYKDIKPALLKNLLFLDEIIGDVELTCGDYLYQFDKYTDLSNMISWFDPPYIITNGNETTITHGFADFTLNDQRDLVDKLLSTNNKILLSGYSNVIYKRLEENGFQKHFIGLVHVKSSSIEREFRAPPPIL